jgi:hypothetical protein
MNNASHQRQSIAVRMIMGGASYQDAMRSTGLSFGEVHEAWLRRSARPDSLLDRLFRVRDRPVRPLGG